MRINSNSEKKTGPPTKPKPTLAKQSVQVFCRLRPLKNLTDKIVVRKLDDHLLEISPPSSKKQIFKFERVFDENTTQKKLFEEVGFPLIKDLISGHNGLIFTYGVTSSGKSHTINGTPQDPGILPRALDTIFNTLNKIELQSKRSVFNPDGKNGFEVQPMVEIYYKQSEAKQIFGTPKSIRKTDHKVEEWKKRVEEDAFVTGINCDNNYAIFVSYFEVYNNYVYDLLDDSSDGRPKRVVDDNQKRCYVQDIKEVEVKSSTEAFDLCIKGMIRKRVANNRLNNESSRSHSVFNIRLVQAPLDKEGVEVLKDKKYIHISQLSIVDLAGCERTGRTYATGNRLKEANNINNSLLTLRKCFDLLRENQKGANNLIPYRDSKLTYLFKNYFEGDGKVEMIICVNPGLEDCNETLQVCKFAEISQEVTTNKILVLPSRVPMSNSEGFFTLYSALRTGPPLPERVLEDPSDDRIIPEWIEALEKQSLNIENNFRLHQENQKIVRNRIVELEKERTLLRQQNAVFQMDLEARENQLKEYENKFSYMERNHESKECQYLKQIQELQYELSSKQDRLSMTEKKFSELQREFGDFKKSIKESWKNECKRIRNHYIRMIHEKQSEMEKMLSDHEKLEIVKKVLYSDNIEFTRPDWMSPLKSVEQVKTPDCNRLEKDLRAVPVANPRYRRSLSCDSERWVDHRPKGTFETGTVFQPIFKSKNKKSVSNLKASDFTNGKKYALTHQQATESGNVETQVFKGQVIPSATGGAQIIFDDVETLVQSPPENLKPITVTSKINNPIRIQQEKRKRLAKILDLERNSPSTFTSTSSNHSSTPTTPKRFKKI